MTLKYIGTRVYNSPNGERLAEFSYKPEEEERFYRIIEKLEEYGYKVTTGVEGWASIGVFDRAEFDELRRDFQHIRRTTK